MPTFELFSNVNTVLGSKMSNYLEIDSKILEKNFLLKNDSSETDTLENFFRSPENYMKDNAAWKLVTPTAGFCVKTTDSNNKKVFINICKLDDIPEPRDVTEAELLQMWESDDVPDFRIPLSIQEPHDEFDKSGNPTVAYDVGLNTKFFQKVQSSAVFRSFVMQVVMEGLENKYNIEIKKEGYVILQNKKKLGELKPHRIRKSPSGGPSKPLIEELQSTSTPSGSGDGAKTCRKTPEFRLFQNSRCNSLIGEFHLPRVATIEDLSLHVNDSRIVLDHRRGSYFADFFIPVKINEAESTASFNITNSILTVKMPIVSNSV